MVLGFHRVREKRCDGRGRCGCGDLYECSSSTVHRIEYIQSAALGGAKGVFSFFPSLKGKGERVVWARAFVLKEWPAVKK
jgi:hypothetical protein